jgi:hypothetical protein
MSYKRQITSGVITKIERKELYFLVTAETDREGAHYITTLRLGVTNYPVAVGDLLCWSSFFNGLGSTTCGGVGQRFDITYANFGCMELSPRK